MAQKLGQVKRPDQGMTLVEVVVAIAILAIGVLSWALMQGSNIRFRDASGRMTVATQLAQSRMEDLADAVSTWDILDGGATFSTNQTLNDHLYTIVETVNGTASLVPDGKSIWHLRVDVRWSHFGEHTVQFERVVTGL